MKLIVLTPDATLVELDVVSVNVAETGNAFTILKNHAPLISVAKKFVVTIKTVDHEIIYIAANAGTIKVLDNKTTIIIDYGVVGETKDEVKATLESLTTDVAQNDDSDDNTIANLEIELIRRMGELRG